MRTVSNLKLHLIIFNSNKVHNIHFYHAAACRCSWCWCWCCAQNPLHTLSNQLLQAQLNSVLDFSGKQALSSLFLHKPPWTMALYACMFSTLPSIHANLVGQLEIFGRGGILQRAFEDCGLFHHPSLIRARDLTFSSLYIESKPAVLGST